MLAAAAVALAAFSPVVVHDSRERFPLASAAAFAPVARDPGDDRPAAYARIAPARGGGSWVQYWLFYAYQDQDRGVLRSGRHEGDWELVQYRVSGSRLLEAVYAQHSGAERCGAVPLRAGHPVVFAARGSHASYFRAGTRDRLWPDPNDEANGRGVLVRPRVVPVSETSPGWMAYRGAWGGSRARWWAPPEQGSPRGPAFQRERWDPEAFAASARPCMATCDTVGECDGAEKALTVAAFALPLLLALGLRARRRGTR